VWKVGERRRTVYLRGRWRDWWAPSRVFQGPRTLEVDVPLDAIPVFVRDGASVP
jgi:alpha-D-xyloside xylohydrolase